MQIRDGDLVDGRYRIAQEAAIRGLSQDSPPVRLYNGKDEQLERPVTLQVLSAGEARDPFQLQRFVLNGQLAAALHHPHVAGVYDAGEWNGWPYWIMARMGDTSADSLYDEQHATPDIAPALAATRRAAEALQAVRAAGMADWTFSHQAVRISPSGDACLYPIMGLEKLHGTDAHFTSSAPQDDPRALSGLLRLLLVGTPDPRLAGMRMLALPPHVTALLDRMYLDDAPSKLTSAGEVAAAIAELEASAGQPTQAYDPAQPPQPAPGSPLAMPYYGPAEASPVAPTALAALAPAAIPASRPDAPTLVAPVPPPQHTRATAPVQARPYVPAPQPAQSPPRRRSSVLPLLPLLALLLLAGAVVVLWPRTNTASGSVAANNAAATPTAHGQLVTVPDLHGMTLEEASGALGLAGLHIETVEPVRDPNFDADTVARQVPDPGTPLQPGEPVTIALSLGPEVATSPPQPAAQEPAVQPNPQPRPAEPKQEPPGKKKKKDKDKDD
ncbi:MAG TPA: PASTA domain-containing protein [Chloroflexia bacterium]|nr:PASTA domain-containing protein [Chloroflexia bacterium]